MTTTPNMALVLPTDGASPGVWDVILDTIFGRIDGHTHLTGSGVPIVSGALNINADVPWQGFSVTGAKAFTFAEVAAAAVAAYSDAIFVNSADHNLYFRNASGTNVQITAGATLNVAIVGGIGGDYSSVGALLSFDDATKRYLLQSEGSPRPWSGLATADIDLYQKAASITNKVTLKSPSALGASYSVTFPAAVPAAASVVMMSTGGVLSVPQASVPLPANCNLVLSGTGYVQRGAFSRRCPVIGALANVTSGTVSTTGGTAGANVPNSTVCYFPLCEMFDNERLISVGLVMHAISGTPTYALAQQSSAGVFSELAGSSTASNATSLLFGPTSPTVLTGTLWLKVTTDGSGATSVVWGDVSTDVP